MSVAALALLGTAVMIGAPLGAILAGPDDWTAPAVAERRERWLLAGCLTAQAMGICLQIVAALRARTDGADSASLWRDGVLLAITAVLSGAAVICIGVAIRVLRRASLDAGESASPDAGGIPGR